MTDLNTGARHWAVIRGQPLHDLLTPFPIAFLVGALAGDVNLAFTRSDFWAETSFWLACAGLISGAATAMLFVIERRPIAHIAGVPAIHLAGNVIALILTAVNLVYRIDRSADDVLPLGIVLSAAVVVVLLATEWFTGDRVFRRRARTNRRKGGPSGR